MNIFYDWLMIFMLLSNLLIFGVSRLRTIVYIFAAQSLILGLCPVIFHCDTHGFTIRHADDIRVFAIAVASISLKTFIFPIILLGSLKKTKISGELVPYVSYSMSLIFGFLSLLLSFWLASKIPSHPLFRLATPIALHMIFVGTFILVSRKKAQTQVTGYLIMENGIFLLGITMVQEIPALIELGMLLDGFAAIFIMCLITYHMDRQFAHTNVDQLNSLKG